MQRLHFGQGRRLPPGPPLPVTAAPWSGLRLELLKHGYRQVHYFEFCCAYHGLYRVGVEDVSTVPETCPRCERRVDSAFLAVGYTRQALPLIEQIDTPLAITYRRELMMKEQREVDPLIHEYHLHLST